MLVCRGSQEPVTETNLSFPCVEYTGTGTVYSVQLHCLIWKFFTHPRPL